MSVDTVQVRTAGPLRGRIRVPGDKSISHRALLFNGIASGTARIRGLLDAGDIRSTAACLRQLGVVIDGDQLTGVGGRFSAPRSPLDCGNSGTTIRLLLGALAGQAFSATLTGDQSLSKRPMRRVTQPLSTLGAVFSDGDTPPVTVHGRPLRNGTVSSPIPSAQVKTALMLAAMQGEGTLRFDEPALSRDHSERLLSAMGVHMTRDLGPGGAHQLSLDGGQVPAAMDIEVPGDISSAAFFLVAGSIVAGSDVLIEHVGLNPTRTGVLDVLQRMGADVRVEEEADVGGEPVGLLRVRGAALGGTDIHGAEIPRLIDELPVIAVAAACADGLTRIRDAAELRVKESDRIATTVAFLQAAGVEAEATADGMVIQGRGGGLQGFSADSHHDHRIAMAAWVAGLVARGETKVSGAAAIQTSFPTFSQLLGSLHG